MNAKAENYEDSTGHVAAEESSEDEASSASSKHSDPIGRSLDLVRSWINKCTDIVSDSKPLVFKTGLLVSSVLLFIHVLLIDLEGLGPANPVILRSGPGESATEQTLGPPKPNQIENESALLSLIRSSLTQGLSSYPRTKEKQNPLISKTTNSRRLPLIAKAQPTQLPPGTFKLGRPMGFDRDRNGKLLAFEQSSRIISSFSGNNPAGRR
jgi:hypothetical protein